MKVVSTLTQAIFDKAHANIPDGLEVVFLKENSIELILKECATADFLLAVGSALKLHEAELAQLKHLKLINTLGVGYDHIDLASCHQFGIPVANTRGTNTFSVAEHVIGGIIALQRRFAESDQAIKDGEYIPFRKQLLQHGIHEMNGAVLGIIGMGNIGKRVATIAHTMGCKILYTSHKRLPLAEEEALGVTYTDIADIWGACDILTLHLPLMETTRHLVNEKTLASMKKGAILVNTARGAIIDAAAVKESLEKGHLGGVVIDTFDPEPPNALYPLLTVSAEVANKIILTPHSAGVTLEAYKRMIEEALQNMATAAAGRTPKNLL